MILHHWIRKTKDHPWFSLAPKTLLKKSIGKLERLNGRNIFTLFNNYLERKKQTQNPQWKNNQMKKNRKLEQEIQSMKT